MRRRMLPALLGLSMACSWSAAAAAAPWHVDGMPATIAQPIVFHNGPVTLRGTLYLPQGAVRVPAVVALHAAEDGDASDALYDHLREGLPAMGIAVLVFDRRGSGASGGSLRNVSYETLADDGIAGARAIAKLPQIDARRIGYWGLSQGGWLAVFAAARDPQAAFAVAVSAPLVTPEAQMEFAMSNRLHVLGYPQADIDAMLAARAAWTGYLRGAVPRAEAVKALAAIDRKPWFDRMYMPSAAELTHDPATSSWRKEMDDDPLAAIERVHVPALFIFGGADPWIPVAATVERLRRVTQTHANVQFAVIAGVDHVMAVVPRETMPTDPQTIRTQAPHAPAYFMLLASWLAKYATNGARSRPPA